MQLKLAVTKFYIYKEKLLNNLSEILKNILQLLKGRQFGICFIIRTRVGFKIIEISSYSFAI